MKIVVKYIADLFGTDNATSSTILISITVFVLGYFVSGISNFVVGLRTRRNYRNIFGTITDAIITNINLQSINFNEISETLNINNSDDFLYKTITIAHLDNVERLDFKMVYDSYFMGFENLFSQTKLKAFNKTFGRLLLIKDTEKQIPSQLNDFITKFNDTENRWNDSIDGIRQYFDNLNSFADGKLFPTHQTEYLTKMDRAILRWQNLENRTHYPVVKVELIDPLLALNREYSDINWTLNFNSLLLNASHHFDNLEKILKVYKSIFYNHSLTYWSTRRTLTKTTLILKTWTITLTIHRFFRSLKRLTRFTLKKVMRGK